MPPLTRIICLANSRKHGAYCLAGIDPSTCAWVRPVSGLDDGRVERATMLVNGEIPKLGDIVEIPLAHSGPDFGFESENRSILDGAWRIHAAVPPSQLVTHCSGERTVLHNGDTFVMLEYLRSLPFEQRRTITLVEAFDFEAFGTGLSAQGGHKWNGSFVSPCGQRLTLRITDPVLAEKLEQGYVPAVHCAVTVSLSMPFRPERAEGRPPVCWKLIAGVVELEPGKWSAAESLPAVKRDSRGPRTAPDDASVDAALKNVFGFGGFKPNQQGIVRAILDGRDCFAAMPTSGGKSLCYQLPAHLLAGTCVVISPLISLMKDQVDAATELGLRAASLTGAQTETERIGTVRRLMNGELGLLYVSPERFAMETFLNNLKRTLISLFAIDEAHCISEWGHDFRPDYLFLSEITKHFAGVPIAAFTATATHRVQKDIIRRLNLRDPFIVRASFNRPNLFYEVLPKAAVEEQIIDFIRTRPSTTGIVYRTTRSSVDATVAALTAAGIKALPYHAGLDDGARRSNQEAFTRDEVDVIVATIAFGMGIDKPNIRFVVHGDLPKNMEAYYQEIGRAGRDGEPARCTLFFGRGDIPKIRYFINRVEDDVERRRLQASLNEMVLYASGATSCRRRKILAYFGEEATEHNCASCDVCAGKADRVDMTTEAQVVLSTVVRTGQRFGAAHIIDILSGANTIKIRQYAHDRLPMYGAGKGRLKKYWQQIVDDLLAEDVLQQTDGQYPTLQITEAGNPVLKGEKRFFVQRMKEIPQTQTVTPAAADDPDLFERLRLLRRQLAHEHSVPPYVIFPDRTLNEMAARKPTDARSMRGIYGIGETKLAAYGAAFIREIASYLGTTVTGDVDKKISAARDLFPPGRSALGPSYEATWELYQKGLGIEAIARERGLRPATITEHLERLILDGKDIAIDALVPAPVREHIERLLPRLKTGLLREIVETASIAVTYEQAKLVRAWVLSGKSKKPPDRT